MKQSEMLEFFSCSLLEEIVAEEKWQQKLSSLVERFEVAKAAFLNCDRFSKELCQNHSPFIQALILHSLRELLISLLLTPAKQNEDDDDEEAIHYSPLQQFFAKSVAHTQKKEPPNEIINKWVPQIAYFLSSDERTVEVEVDGELVALIKPGKLRQECDMFLSQFSQELIEKMRLPGKMLDVFLPSHACNLHFFQLQTRKPLTAESEFNVSTREKGTPVFQHMSLRKNIADVSKAFSGGIQEFIKPSATSDLSVESRRTVLLFFLCLLGARDLKSDGMIGDTVVDCEDFLEEKKGYNKEFPKLNVPYVREILDEPIDIDVLKRILTMMNRVKINKLEEYVFEFDYEPNTMHSRYEIEVDAREDYVYPNPTFADNRLLSHEQIGALISNWKCLKLTLENLTSRNTCTVHDMLEFFDPEWANARKLFVLIYRAGVESRPEELACFPPDQIQELKQFSRVYINKTPDDLSGSYTGPTPKPTEEGWRRWSSQSLSRSGSPLATSSPDIRSIDPKTSDLERSTSALNISNSS